MKCTNCGKEVKSGEVFCGECGAKINWNQQPSASAERTENTGSNQTNPRPVKKASLRPLIIYAIFMACFICGLLIRAATLPKMSSEERKQAFAEKKAAQREKNKAMFKNMKDSFSEIGQDFADIGKDFAEEFGISDAAQQTLNKLKNVAMEKTDKGVKLSVQNLNFKANSDELIAEDLERITDIASVLKDIKGKNFLVTGYIANTGTPDTAADIDLSLRRANTVVKEMVNAGISSKRFMVVGAGSEDPIADNSTEEGRAKNRRVEITILK